MALSREVRRLDRAWRNDSAWPKRLNWLEVDGLRGWHGDRVEFRFPIVAMSGENGTGKSTVLQAAACVYRDPKNIKDSKYASEFFPKTAWDTINDAAIRFGYSEERTHKTGSVRKPSERWKGNIERPRRKVAYIDLSRILPVSGRVGYAKIAKSKHIEASSTPFEVGRLSRLSEILGRPYRAAKMALSNVDKNRLIPVLQRSESYSGYHQGQGETTIAELTQADLPEYSLLLIDEIESSLHPRAQRRLIRDLASVSRDREIQIILTTHSPYVLEELPPDARLHIFEQNDVRQIMVGVSPQFAMTKMDDILHPDCELYAEDQISCTLVMEMLSQRSTDLAARCTVTSYGASSVGYQLGQMVANKRFPRAVGVFLDGDCGEGDGCFVLPGGDAPERVVFEGLRQLNWRNLWTRLSRDISLVTDACEHATTLSDHHEWVRDAAQRLVLGGDVLWHAMCAEWVEHCASAESTRQLIEYIEDQLADYS